MEHFKTLNTINVNDHTEQKDGLTYLSWAWAWAEVKSAYPDATYTIKRFDGKPYLFDEELGYMVFTEMTIENHTHEMWLPVMNGAKKSMKNKPYTYDVKKFEWDNQKRRNVWNGEYEQKTVEAATMFDINTAIMRCLTKNIAMFGLGLYIYAGEDLPECEMPETEPQPKADNNPAPAPAPVAKPVPAPIAKQESKQETKTGNVDFVITFGKHNGKTIRDIYDEDAQYIEWLAENAQKDDVKQAAKEMIKIASKGAEIFKPADLFDDKLPWE